MITTTNYHNENDITTIYTCSKADVEYNEMVQELTKNIAKVVNKLVPIKMRKNVRKELIGGEGSVQNLTNDEKKYVVLCKIWLRAYYAGDVNLEIKQPWHKRSRKQRRI